MKKILFLLAFSAAIFAGCTTDTPSRLESLVGTEWQSTDIVVEGGVTYKTVVDVIFDTSDTYTEHRVSYEGSTITDVYDNQGEYYYDSETGELTVYDAFGSATGRVKGNKIIFPSSEWTRIN